MSFFDLDYCAEMIKRPGGWPPMQCGHKHRPGSQWCGTHSPAAVCARKHRALDRKLAKRTAERKRKAAAHSKSANEGRQLERAAIVAYLKARSNAPCIGLGASTLLGEAELIKKGGHL